MTAAPATAERAALVARTTSRGAYGLRLLGVDEAHELLVPAPPAWQTLELVSRLGGGRPPLQWVRPGEARLALQGGGRVDVDWTRGRAVFTTPRPLTAGELVHPYLAPVAGLAAHRIGRENFHAGGVVAGDGAWVVLGDKGAGKSSLLAELALAGHAVLADDLLVIDEQRRALAGPRSIDLRADAAKQFQAGEPLGMVGTRERYRLVIAAVPAAVPLRGFVVLAWGDQVRVDRVPPSIRLAELARGRVTRIAPADAGPLFEFAALPMLEFRRPRRWPSGADAAACLVEELIRSA